MRSGTCTLCHEHYLDLDAHEKQPVFETICPDYGETWDGMSVEPRHAHNHEDAAVLTGESNGSAGDGPFAGTILVRRQGETEVVRFLVDYETSVDYFAKEESRG